MLKDLEELFNDRFAGRRKYEDFKACKGADHSERKILDRRKSWIADDELRDYHSFLLRVVVDHLRVDKDVVFSYRKGVNVADAVRCHSNSKFIFKTDLKDFFNSINEKLVEGTLLGSVASLPFAFPEKHISHIVQLLTAHGGLPAGYATSPSLSNACLYQFDQEFGGVCKQLNMIYTRYSDDIIVSGDDFLHIRNSSYLISEALGKLYDGRFFANFRKSKFYSKSGKVKILGLVILPNGHVTVDRAVRNKLEAMLHFYISNVDRFEKISGCDFVKAKLKVAGHLNYINSIDAGYIQKLRRRYGSVIIDSFFDLSTIKSHHS